MRGLTRGERVKNVFVSSTSYGAPTRAPLTRPLRGHPLPQGARVMLRLRFGLISPHPQAGIHAPACPRALQRGASLVIRVFPAGRVGAGGATLSGGSFSPDHGTMRLVSARMTDRAAMKGAGTPSTA
ncbi:hypothetical protein MTBLM5_100006 [Magnetospirillum sp. LM-5]|nr:hypothetical protein MTBLM5_100006 [Magnetospirillum sp. LM-5]